MMKKIISAFLSVALVLGTMLTISAENLSDNVQVTVDVQTVHVTVNADEKGVLTGYIISANEDDANIYGVAQTKNYEATEDGYTYKISIVMPLQADKGTYTVCLGDVYHGDHSFSFVGLKAMVEGFNSLDQAESEDIYELLTNPDSTIPYDVTKYVSLKEEVRDLVDAEIASWSLATTLETAEAVTSTFIQKMDEVMKRAMIANADKADFEALAKEAIENEILDDKFTDKVQMEVIRKYMGTGTVTSIASDDLAEKFSESVLLAVAEASDYITLYDATIYYEEKGIVDADADKLEKLKKANLHYDVFKKLKDKTYQSIDVYEDELETIVEEYLAKAEEEDDDSSSGGGSSGGGGGGGGGGSGRPQNSSGNTSQSTPAKPVPTVSFNDIQSVAWANDAIIYLAERGVISGRGNGVFAPNDVVTREEFVKLIVAAFATSTSGTSCNFVDVSADRWSYPYIATATELGLVAGVDAEHFNPTGGMTREDFAVILYRTYKLAGGKEVTASDLTFTDTESISDYAKDAVAALTEIGVLHGMGDGTYAPKAVVTRAQAAKAIYELLMLVGGGK